MTRGRDVTTQQNYGDSPVRRSRVPIASSRLASLTRGTASRLPWGRQWSPGLPSQARARHPAPTLCRALVMQAARVGNRAAARGGGASGGVLSSARDDDGAGFTARCASSEKHSRRSCELGVRTRCEEKLSPRRSREGTPPALLRMRLARSIGKGRPARPTTPDESVDNWGAGSASLPPRLKHAGHAPE